MQIGIGLDQGLGLTFEQHRTLMREAVEQGYDCAWTPAGLGRDAFHVCAQWHGATVDTAAGGIQTGISVLPVPIWSAPALAATAATLGELTGGRFILGIGTGGIYSTEYRHSLSVPAYPPIAMMRDYVTTLRRLIAGEVVTHEGTAVTLRGVQIGVRAPQVPLYLGALGPQMLRLVGEAADGACLNWCSPDQIAWSRQRIAAGAERANRNPANIRVSEYIRVCVDDDEQTARRGLARAVLGYALARPGASKDAGYRGHFARMGFDDELMRIEAARDGGAADSELIDLFSPEFLRTTSYYGPASGAQAAVARLATGLDTAIVRVVAARPGIESVRAVMHACAPIRAAD